MKGRRTGLVALAAAVCLLAAPPAFAATVMCTAKDSAGKRWSETQTSLLEWTAKTVAEALAKADCQDHSRHPATCVVVRCKTTQK